jgi:TRAP-type C4-dicarboxylate transport system permease small subunit
MGMIKTILRVSEFLDRVLKGVIYVALLLMVFTVFGQVIFRYILSAPPSWTEELARYIFIWVSFLAATYAYRKNAHIVIDVITSKLPNKFKEIYYYLVTTVIVFFLGVLFVQSIFSFEVVGTAISPSLGLNMKYVHLSLTVSSLLMIFYTIVILIERKKLRTEGEGHLN